MGENRMSDMSLTPDQIREGRERRHMTQQQLADEVGVSRRTVTSWERGQSVPRNRMAPLVELLGLSVSEYGRDAVLARLGQLAKQRREEIGLGRPQFAREADLGSDRTMVQFEFGRTLPSGGNQRKIEKALGWRIGVIDDIMRMVNRKASEIQMEAVDAEDSLNLAAQSPKSLALYSDEDLLDEVRRRMMARTAQHPHLSGEAAHASEPQNLYGLAASTNTEHLEDEEGNNKAD
jgi:transcriptional regulator with XRE-family HTH domain